MGYFQTRLRKTSPEPADPLTFLEALPSTQNTALAVDAETFEILKARPRLHLLQKLS